MPTQVARVMSWARKARFSFKELKEPRRQGSCLHSLRGLASLMVAATACLHRTFRAMESFGEDLGGSVLHRLGLVSPPSDTTMYNLSIKLTPEGWRPELWRQVKRAWRAGLVRNDRLAAGQLAFDGKGSGGAAGLPPNASCRTSVCSKEHDPCWDVFTSRAVLVSSSACPCLDVELLPMEVGEHTAFRPMFQRMVKRFGAWFRYVSVDGGVASRENAKIVRAAGKHYVFALKANFGKLYPWAMEVLLDTPFEIKTPEREQGLIVTRTLRVAAVPKGFDFPDATQLWLVERHVRDHRGRVVEKGSRAFVTSIPSSELEPRQILKVVRLHWGIENGHNWTADVILNDDNYRPCNQGEASATLPWVRALAYNLLAIFRAAMLLKDRHPISWSRAAEKLTTILEGARSPAIASSALD